MNEQEEEMERGMCEGCMGGREGVVFLMRINQTTPKTLHCWNYLPLFLLCIFSKVHYDCVENVL